MNIKIIGILIITIALRESGKIKLILLYLLENNTNNFIVFGETNCLPQVKHYEELNCEPTIDKSTNCPIKYKCPEYQTNPNPEKCLINGKFYERGDKIPDNDVGILKENCFCDK